MCAAAAADAECIEPRRKDFRNVWVGVYTANGDLENPGSARGEAIAGFTCTRARFARFRGGGGYVRAAGITARCGLNTAR